MKVTKIVCEGIKYRRREFTEYAINLTNGD